MAVPTPQDTKTNASDSSASTTHTITLNNAIWAQGGSTSPATILVSISYDGNTGGIVTGVTDTLGNTYALATEGGHDAKQSNGAGVNLEAWYAYNCTAGSAPTITVTLSASQKAKLAAVVLPQVRPISPIDEVNGRIDTTSSATRAAEVTPGYARKVDGQIGIYIGITGWNDTRTVSGNGSTWTGTGSGNISLAGGSSNLGIAMQWKNTTSEQQLISATNHIARFTMSSSTTNPSAVMTVCFFRDGVVTTTDEDGYIQNIENVPTAYSTSISLSPWGFCATFASSTSAPGGGTGSSETDRTFFFFPDYSSYLLSGVTIGANIDLKIKNAGGGFDDGTNYMTETMYIYKNGTFGSTLDTTDDGAFTGSYFEFSNNFTNSSGLWVTKTFDKATYYNTSGYTTVGIMMSGDTGGFASSTWGSISDYSTNAPAYLVLALTYPTLTTTTPGQLSLAPELIRFNKENTLQYIRT